MNQRSSDSKNNSRFDEFSIIELFHYIVSRSKFIIKITSIFFVFGILYALTAKVEFEARCKLLLDKQNENAVPFRGLSGLVGLTGIDITGSQSQEITPELYPEIMMSYPFLMKVMNRPIEYNKSDTLVSTYVYLTEIDNPSVWEWIYIRIRNMPSLIKNIFSSRKSIEDNLSEENEILFLSKEKLMIYNSFKERIRIEVNKRNGMISISTKLPDPIGAAQLTNVIVKELTDYIIKYKIQKSEENLIFIQKRFEESRNEFELAQKRLAIFNDRNKNVITALAKVEGQKLQDEYNISYEVYKNLASQLEQAKIKVKEDTPVFTIIDPVLIPVEKSEPKRKLITIIFILLGLLVSSSIITFRFLFGS